jgi:hypothetical protein
VTVEENMAPVNDNVIKKNMQPFQSPANWSLQQSYKLFGDFILPRGDRYMAAKRNCDRCQYF